MRVLKAASNSDGKRRISVLSRGVSVSLISALAIGFPLVTSGQTASVEPRQISQPGLDVLSARQEALTSNVDSLRTTFTSMFQWCFGAIGMIVGLTTILQFVQGRREHTLLQEQIKKYQDILGKQNLLASE